MTIAVLAALVLSACGGGTPPTAKGGSGSPWSSPSEQPSSSAAAGPDESAEPSEAATVTDPPLIVSPLPSFGKPTAPGGAAFAPSRANETAGSATLTVNQWAGLDVDGPVVQTTALRVPCFWTSKTSVRGAFYQRISILGQNDVLIWSVAQAPEGPAGGAVTILPDGPDMALADEEFPSEPVDVTVEDAGLVSGSLKFRSLNLPPEMTATGGAFVNGSIAWNCGAAPAGASYMPAPYASPSIEGTVTVASRGASKPMKPGCGGTYYGPDGTPAEIPVCPSTWDAIAPADAVTVAAGGSLTVSTGRAWLLSTFSNAYFVAASTVPGPGLDVPANAAGTARAAAHANDLTFRPPGTGDWYAFVPLICLDPEGNRLEYWWAARILVR